MACMYACMYACIYVCVYVWMHVCVCMYMYVRMHAFMYVYVCIHVHRCPYVDLQHRRPNTLWPVTPSTLVFVWKTSRNILRNGFRDVFRNVFRNVVRCYLLSCCTFQTHVFFFEPISRNERRSTIVDLKMLLWWRLWAFWPPTKPVARELWGCLHRSRATGAFWG